MEKPDNRGDPAALADSGGTRGAGWGGPAAAGAAGVVTAAVAAPVPFRRAARVGNGDDEGTYVKRQRGKGRVMLAGAAAMCAVVALPGNAWAAGEPSPYAFDSGAKKIAGAAQTGDAPTIEAGSVYRDSIRGGEKRYYRMDLDAKANVYVSAVAVPRLKTTVKSSDNIKVTIQDGNAYNCSYDDADFGLSEFPRPIANNALRGIGADKTDCQEAGSYYVVVERKSEGTSSPDPWELEISPVTEPGLEPGSTAPPKAPESWPSQSPAPVGGGPKERAGGTGFFDAPGLESGEWKTRIEAGESLFYKVPVDWGQQLFVAAELGSSKSFDDARYVSGALDVEVFNPARGLVDDASTITYTGKQVTAAVDPMPPVAYENRTASPNNVSETRFAGWYYLRVALSPEVKRKFSDESLGLNLRINVTGKAKKGPAYDGDPGIFAVTSDDKEAAASGQSTAEQSDNGTMKLVAAAGIGAGTVLVLGLGVWTLLGRRRALGG
ncbi:hypothetical protein [Streptomyces sp. NPDC050504]|uniref:hypothetical protein n=1 Tax=Streptomyces sp. NPDC050504 TaxID=3365618 RepID=UPI0037A262C9